VKAFILNHVEERREFAHWMVQSAGFLHVDFPPTIAWEQIDLEAQVDAGKIVPNFMKQQSEVYRKKYVAHALDYVNTLGQAEAEGHSWVAVFEDDMVLTTLPSEASRRIRLAIEQVPVDADSIHLEWCLDKCRLARVREGDAVVSTAERPFCAAAILFSAKGLRKALRVLQPLFSAIDNMLADVCERRLLNCYKLRFPAFAQDMYWGSELAKKTRTSTHELDDFDSLCEENNVEWLLNHVNSSRTHVVDWAETTIGGKVHRDGAVARHVHKQVRHPDDLPIPFSHYICQRTADEARQTVIFKIISLDPNAVYLFTLEVDGLNVRGFEYAQTIRQTVRGPMNSNVSLLEEWATSGKERTHILKFMYAFTCSVYATGCAHDTEFEFLLPPADAGAMKVLASVYDTHHESQQSDQALGKISPIGSDDGEDLLTRVLLTLSLGSKSCPDEVTINSDFN
jgi:hypothetical protein